MSTRSFIKALAILLTITFVAPFVFFAAPQKVRAQYPVGIVYDISPTNNKTMVESTITAIKTTLSEVHEYTSMIADEAQWWNTFVLQPLAFVLSGQLMKMLTASVINFVIGKANGTGVPQFVVDVQKSLQTVSDAKALAFFGQYGRNSNSPFASSIASSLRSNYLAKTSLAGFWASNMSTLAQSTPSYQPGYLTGNWSQGGIAAWFALTTRTENNPYMLYPAAQETLSTLIGPGVGGATGARVAELGWGKGFMSWCGTSDAADQTQSSASANYQACQAAGGTGADCQYAFDSTGGTMPGSTGVNPGDACTNKDGTPGTIKTPGSVIVDTLNKTLGGQQDIITRMGNVGGEITGILKDVGTVFQTVGLASQILGGSGSGGLFGVDQPSSANSTSRLADFQNKPLLNTTPSTIYSNAASSPVLGSNTASGRVDQYESAWNTIRSSANTASTSAVSLATFCNAAADTAAQAILNAPVDGWFPSQQAPTNLSSVHSYFIDSARAQADTAIAALAPAGAVGQVLAKAATAASVVTAARAAAAKVQADLAAATTEAQTAQATADMAALQMMPPTDSDLANVQQDIQVFGMAVASPPGSLNVSGGSLLDQMNLVSTNAATLKTTVCNPNSSLYVTQMVSGG
ncbi:MAG: hypothetical protein PHD04_02785 [Candidatus Pacebacteria bacterium]|nr:hypothetical protein [Candidatus Paceibacterota bacterium]